MKVVIIGLASSETKKNAELWIGTAILIGTWNFQVPIQSAVPIQSSAL